MKRVKDMITPETARRVKGMSLPELNTYLYSIYAAGYGDGLAEGMKRGLAIAQDPAPKEASADG